MAIDYSVFQGLGCAHPKGATRLEDVASEQRQAKKSSREARAAVWKRDEGKCRCCGVSVERSLSYTPKQGQVHHVAKRSKFRALLTDVRNLILLCARCHEDVERKRIYLVAVGKGSMFTLDGQQFIDAGHAGVRFTKKEQA